MQGDSDTLGLVLAAFRQDDVKQSGTITADKLQRILKLLGPDMSESSVSLLLDELQQRFGAGPGLLHYETALAWLFGQSPEAAPELELESGERLEAFIDLSLVVSLDFGQLSEQVQDALRAALQKLFSLQGGVEEHFVDVFLFGEGEVSCQVYLPEFAGRRDADAIAKSLASLDSRKILEAVNTVPDLKCVSIEGKVKASVAERMTTTMCRRTTRTTILLPVLEEDDDEECG